MEIPALTEISDGYVSVLADGVGSVVDLSQLTGFRGNAGSGAMEARNGGEIRLPQLVEATRMQFKLGAQGGMALPALSNLDHSSLSVQGSVSISLPSVKNVDRGSLRVQGGAVLSLPSVQTFTNLNSTAASWVATDPGSRIVLGGLKNIVLQTGYPFE